MSSDQYAIDYWVYLANRGFFISTIGITIGTVWGASVRNDA